MMAGVADIILRIIGKDQASPAVKDVTGNLRGMDDAARVVTGGLDGLMAAAGVAGLAVLAKQVGEAVWELANLGAEAARVEDAFMRVSAGVGVVGSDIVAAMDAATLATVDDEALMQVATNSMIMGLRLTGKEWGNLAAGARYHARLIGEDTRTVFSGMLEAITRGQPRMLAALKFPGARDAINEMAEGLDGAASSMTEAERQAALLELVMGTLTDEMGKYGEMMPDMIDRTDQLKRKWEDLKESMGQGLLETAGAWNILDNAAEQFEGQMIRNGEVYTRMASGAWRFDEALTAETKAQQAANQVTSYWIARAAPYEAATRKAADATAAFVKAMPKASDAAGWKAYVATVNAELNKLTLNLHMTKAEADQFREGMYAGLGGRGESAVAIATAHAATLAANEQLAQDTADAWKKAAEDSASAWESAWDDLRGTVEAALQATGVTAEDLAATASGVYVDKWDENIRRLNAIAANGFAELQAHPDWAAVLEIPPEVLSGTEQQLKDWAAGTAKAAPTGLFDIDAAVAIVEQYVAEQAAHEALIDAVAAEYARRHGMGLGAAKKAVGGVMGGPEEAGKTAADDMLAGLTGQLEKTSPASVFVDAMNKDITAQAKLLKGTGESLWLAMELGIVEQMNESDYVYMFAMIIAPVVAKLLSNPYGNPS